MGSFVQDYRAGVIPKAQYRDYATPGRCAPSCKASCDLNNSDDDARCYLACGCGPAFGGFDRQFDVPYTQPGIDAPRRAPLPPPGVPTHVYPRQLVDAATQPDPRAKWSMDGAAYLVSDFGGVGGRAQPDIAPQWFNSERRSIIDFVRKYPQTPLDRQMPPPGQPRIDWIAGDETRDYLIDTDSLAPEFRVFAGF